MSTRPLSQDFTLFIEPLVGLPVSRVWQGYGSAIFTEFGRLHSTRKRDGQPGSPRGDWIELSRARREFVTATVVAIGGARIMKHAKTQVPSPAAPDALR